MGYKELGLPKPNFEGWATKNDLQCSDGRIIRKDAFKHCDGMKVPLVWNHDHTDPYRVVGHTYLEHRDTGVWAYGYLNDSELGKTAKIYVEHGDIDKLSIYANQLKQQGPNVMHGTIREVSLVLAAANPGACIENVIVHGEESDEEAVIHTGETFDLCQEAEQIDENVVEHSEENEEEESSVAENEKTIKDVYDAMTEEQKDVVHAMVGMALEEAGVDTDENEEGGNDEMKHGYNVFDETETVENGGVLTHADQEAIIELAKKSGVGNLQEAIAQYVTSNDLAHGLDLGDTEVLNELLPDHKLLNPGAPDILRADQSWVMGVINKLHKSPYSRVRTRKADARQAELKAKGFKKGEEKKFNNHIKLIGRKTEPTTVYIKESLHRDDIIDITDFDAVNYVWGMMKDTLYETLALSVLVGDGREDADPDKISEENIRPIWKDEELYTIHRDVDLEAARAELQGTETGAHFGENYIYAEAMITAALYAREQYKGTGTPDYYCAPHSVNIMLLARDLNGRRIYDSKADLAKALNVNNIIEIEQLEGKTRKDGEGNTKKLHGIFVNLSDYQLGSTKGGEITKFSDFNIDFNKYTYLMETRLSGALTEPFGAIALEEPVENVAG